MTCLCRLRVAGCDDASVSVAPSVAGDVESLRDDRHPAAPPQAAAAAAGDDDGGGHARLREERGGAVRGGGANRHRGVRHRLQGAQRRHRVGGGAEEDPRARRVGRAGRADEHDARDSPAEAARQHRTPEHCPVS